MTSKAESFHSSQRSQPHVLLHFTLCSQSHTPFTLRGLCFLCSACNTSLPQPSPCCLFLSSLSLNVISSESSLLMSLKNTFCPMMLSLTSPEMYFSVSTSHSTFGFFYAFTVHCSPTTQAVSIIKASSFFLVVS